MNPRILNKEFQHPGDGWYQIESLGNHPNRAAAVVQVIDAEAAASIVNRFNADAAAGTLRHGSEMLIDHEHFSDNPDKESRAYGWLQELQNRADGIYGKVRWTTTGQAAVDGGDYRFFSTEYAANDLAEVKSAIGNRQSAIRQVRPLRLDGLSLTNMNNNRGQRPITNRILNGDVAGHEFHGNQFADVASEVKNTPSEKRPATWTRDGKRPMNDAEFTDHVSKRNAMTKARDEFDAHVQKNLAPTWGTTAKAKTFNKDFAGSRETVDSQQKTNQGQKMKTVCTLLELSADASEEAVHAAVTKLKNRNTELEPLATENETLKNRVTTHDAEQVTSLLAERKVTDAKTVARLQPVLAKLANRADRVSFLDDCGFKAEAAKPATAGKVINRENGKPAAEVTVDTGAQTQLVESIRIKNRCSYRDAWDQAKREKPELFAVTN